jgi:hypothetical protein
MAAEPVFFRDLAYVLIAAVLGGGSRDSRWSSATSWAAW